MKRIELPNKDLLDFPDDMDDKSIESAIQLEYPEYAPRPTALQRGITAVSKAFEPEPNPQNVSVGAIRTGPAEPSLQSHNQQVEPQRPFSAEPVDLPGSVMHGVVPVPSTEPMIERVGAPVRPEIFEEIKYRFEAATPEQRIRMQSIPGAVGNVARRIAQTYRTADEQATELPTLEAINRKPSDSGFIATPDQIDLTPAPRQAVPSSIPTTYAPAKAPLEVSDYATALLGQGPIAGAVGAISGAIRGKDVSKPDTVLEAIAQAGIDFADSTLKEFTNRGIPQSVVSAGQSIGYSVATMAPMAVPYVGNGVSFLMMYRGAQNQFMNEVRNSYEAVHGKTSDAEWNARAERLGTEAMKFGAFEAVPEFASDKLFFGILGSTFGKKAVGNLMNRLGTMYGLQLANESGSETVTNMGQGQAVYDALAKLESSQVSTGAIRRGEPATIQPQSAPLTEGRTRPDFASPQSYAASFKEVLPPVALSTLILGGGGAMIRNAINPAAPTVPGAQPPATPTFTRQELSQTIAGQPGGTNGATTQPVPAQVPEVGYQEGADTPGGSTPVSVSGTDTIPLAEQGVGVGVDNAIGTATIETPSVPLQQPTQQTELALPEFSRAELEQVVTASPEPQPTNAQEQVSTQLKQIQENLDAAEASIARSEAIKAKSLPAEQAPLKPLVETLISRKTPAASTLGRKLNLQPAIVRAKELMAGTRPMTAAEVSWWNRTATKYEQADAPAAEAARAIAQLVKAGKPTTVNEVRDVLRDSYPNDIRLSDVTPSVKEEVYVSSDGSTEAANTLSLEPGQVEGTYLVTAKLVEVSNRKLPRLVASMDDAARAFSNMQRYAVEHYDMLVTDKDGKPLAVVGSFKGAVAQTPVFIDTLALEVAQIPGAAYLWGSHNHPSGKAVFSQQDYQLNEKVARLFDRTGIDYRGFFVMTRSQDDVLYGFVNNEGRNFSGRHAESDTGSDLETVPVMERMSGGDPAPFTITEAALAKSLVPRIAKDRPGVLVLSYQHAPIAFIPVNPKDMAQLRVNGRFIELVRQLGSTVPGAVFIANPNESISLFEGNNLGAALRNVGIIPLDMINYTYNDSIAAHTITSLTTQANSGAEQGTFHPDDVFDSLRAPSDEAVFAEQKLHSSTKETILAEIKKEQPSWMPYIERLLERGERNVRGGLIIDSKQANAERLASLLSAKSAATNYSVHPLQREEQLDRDEQVHRLQDKFGYSRQDAIEEYIEGKRLDENGKLYEANYQFSIRPSSAWNTQLQFTLDGKTYPVNTPQGRALMLTLDKGAEFATQIAVRGIKGSTKSAMFEGHAKAYWNTMLDTIEKSIGMEIGRSEVRTPDIQFSTKGNNWYYSQLQRAIEAAPERLFTTGKSFKAWLESNAPKLGVKKDELFWSGLTEWLDMNPGAITKLNVTSFLSIYGEPQVQETELGSAVSGAQLDALHKAEEKAADRRDSLRHEVFGPKWTGTPTPERESAAISSNLSWWVKEASQGNQESLQKIKTLGWPEERIGIALKYGKALLEHEATSSAAAAAERKDRTKFRAYQLPGAGEKNYRELLLTLPPTINELEQWHVMRPSGYVDSTYATEESARIQAQRRGEGYTVQQTATIKAEGGFRSPHFGQPNILAHIRFNERTDAEGKRVLFLEEIQSDWGQKGKKEGFDPAQKVEGLTTTGIPLAPFVTDTKSWTALALKRMIRYAAENGFDKIAWTTGEQQTARYDLSKQIDRLYWKPTGEGIGNLAAQKGNSEVFDKFGIPESEIEGYVGKDVAKKLLAAELNDSGYKIVGGIDLRVGGEGMKGYYDQIVPQVANDILKKIGGGKVEQINIGARKGEPTQYADFETWKNAPEFENKFQQGFAITPELKAKVLSEGLPLFSVKASELQSGMYVPELGLAFINSDQVNKKEAVAVILHEMTHASDTDSKMAELGESVLKRIDAYRGIPIYDRVFERIQLAGQEGNSREALNYLVEEALQESHRAGFSRMDSGFFRWAQRNLHFSIAHTLKRWLAIIRAAMYKRGLILKAEDLSIDDMIAVAVSGMKEIATGKREAAGARVKGRAIVNIGLNVNDGSKLSLPEVRKALSGTGVEIVSENTFTSDTEPTLVAELSRPLTKDEAFNVSKLLRQDAIAQLTGEDGFLAGPKAAEWGEYNPEFFILPNGNRAAEPTRVGLVAPLTGVHFSADQRETLSGKMYGRGIKGAEAKRLADATDDRIKTRISFYVDEGQGVFPESGVGNQRHEVTLDNLYDAANNPLRLSVDSLNNFESAVLDAGFDGYYVKEGFGRQGVAVLLGKASESVKVEQRVRKSVRPDEFVANYVTANPSALVLKGLVRRSQEKLLRGLFDGDLVGGTLYVWDAYYATHEEAANALGLNYDFAERIVVDETDGLPLISAEGTTLQNVAKHYSTSNAVLFEKSGYGYITGEEYGRTEIQMSRKIITGDTGRTRTPEQLASFENLGRAVETPSVKERTAKLWHAFGKNMAQGLADQFAPIEDIDHEAYRLLRQSKGASGAFAVLLEGGKLKLADKTYSFDTSKRGGVIETLLVPLQGEADDFLWWVAAHRAEHLTAQTKENLFTPQDIAAMKSLGDGNTKFDYTLQHGAKKGTTTRDRLEIYSDALATFNGFNRNVLDMAEQSGMIDPVGRKIWEYEFYVPFYRVSDDDVSGLRGINVKQGVVRQQAFKHLKGGTGKLNTDLLENTLLNWSHLLDASAKNRAAKAALEAAEKIEVAHEIGSPEKNSVWFMDKGQKRHFVVDDPAVMTAVTALEYAGMRGPMMDALSKPKHMLTTGVTASPFFKIRNLIRDSVHSIAVAPMSYNVAKNVIKGFKGTKRNSDSYFTLLANGGMIHFGTMLENREADRVRSLVEKGVDRSTILDNESNVRKFYRRVIEPSITAYNELGNRGEAINRFALYQQLIAQGVPEGEAAFQARDLLDFSMGGAWTSVRFVTQTVPFMNARIQGIYKLGKAAKQDPARVATVLTAVATVSIALMLLYKDDDDWKRREDWDRDTYWWFKVGGIAYRVPKPFEIGAVATLAERGVELFASDEMTGERFMQRVYRALADNLSMNPIPQAVKPLLDVYANKDSFTGREIESQGMELLEPEYRYRAGTTIIARGLSTAANAVVPAPSPVQIDHLVRGYFGWLGSFIVQAADIIARPVTGQPVAPATDPYKTATGGLIAGLEGAPSRYVTQMYEQSKEIEQAYATYRSLIKKGSIEEAKEYAEENKSLIVLAKSQGKTKRAISKLNASIREIEQSREMTSAEKRVAILEIQKRKEVIAKRMLAASKRGSP